MKNVYFIFLIYIVSYSQDLNYEYTVTFGNHVIAIEEINYDFSDGDIVGCFFINSDGNLQCCGSTVYSGQETVFVSAWPDDSFTDYDEGFIDGDGGFLAFRLCNGIDYYGDTVIGEPVIYETNGISSLSIWLDFYPPDCSNIYLNESLNQSKKTLKVTDLMGRVIEENIKNQVIIVLYNDGTVEKKFN